MTPNTDVDSLPPKGYNHAPMGRKLKPPAEGPGSEPTPIGERIRAARERANLTQGEAAARMPNSVKVQYWSDVERGRRTPSLEWLWEAAGALGCDPSKLDGRLARRPRKRS